MKKQKNIKIVVAFLIIFVMIVVGVLAFIVFQDRQRQKNNQLPDLERISKVLSSTKPTSLFVRGEAINFDGLVDSEQIDVISTASVISNNEYKVLVINDLNDEVNLNDDEIAFVEKFISDDYNMLIYLGHKYETTWDDKSTEIANIEGNMCYIYYSWGGKPVRDIGAWNETDQETVSQFPYLLGETILYSIESYLQ